jgi:sarcosine oxidase subunit beta
MPRFSDIRLRKVWGGLIDLTPDALPVLSADCGVDGLTVGCGFSGHGFGIGPITGAILADLSTTGRSKHEIASFAIDRPELLEEGGAAELHG